MIEERQLSKSCYYYELFMERAYGKYERNIPGPHACIMMNLMAAEKGKIISADTVSLFEEQLTEVKKNIEEAIDRYLAKPRFPVELIDQMKEYKSQVVWAVSSSELMDIVFKVIDYTAAVSIVME